MNELQKTIKEQIELREKEFPESDRKEHKVKFIGAKYFAVFKNGEIHHSDNDEILERTDIEFALVFPKISYIPQSARNETYLEVITINSKMEVFNGELLYNDWIINFSYQKDFRRQQLPLHVWIKNSEIGFSEHLYDIWFGHFYIYLRILFAILKCDSKKDADFIYEYHKKDGMILFLKEILHLKF